MAPLGPAGTPAPLRHRTYVVIFRHDTPGEKRFDVALIAAILVLGCAIIAVPTGIVTAEITAARTPPRDADRPCPSCGAVGHERDARFCRRCASPL